MGLQIIIPGADFMNYTDIIQWPINDGLLGLYTIGKDAASSTYNNVTKATDAITVGSGIAFSDHYAALTGESNENYILTPIVNTTNDITIVSLGRHSYTGTEYRVEVGNFSGLGTANFSRYFFMPNPDGGTLQIPWPKVTEIPSVANKFIFKAGVIANNTAQAFSGTGEKINASAVTTYTNNRSISSVPFRIGGDAISASTYDGPLDIARAAVYNRALSQSELALLYRYIRFWYTKRGIVVA